MNTNKMRSIDCMQKTFIVAKFDVRFGKEENDELFPKQ
jgi:hypothetical protein